jgi:tripartite-type tricarboxylate transporter receptor subunit TctC
VASSGAGTTPSLAIEMLKQAFDVNFVTAPFAGAGLWLNRFTPISCNAVTTTPALINAGKVRALAVTSKQRLETLPDIPTLDELGIKNQESETMVGVFVLAATPQPVVELSCYRKKPLRSSICPTSKHDYWTSPQYRTATPRPTSPRRLKARSLSGSA